MTKILDILEYYLEQRGYSPFRIDGGVSQPERQRQVLSSPFSLWLLSFKFACQIQSV
jgi:hypothetical protein